jgi:hypothetical protein
VSQQTRAERFSETEHPSAEKLRYRVGALKLTPGEFESKTRCAGAIQIFAISNFIVFSMHDLDPSRTPFTEHFGGQSPPHEEPDQ